MRITIKFDELTLNKAPKAKVLQDNAPPVARAVEFHPRQERREHPMDRAPAGETCRAATNEVFQGASADRR